MKEPIVNSDEIDEDRYGGCPPKYNGKFFTGTIIYDDTDPVSYSEYTDGEEDGKSISYYRNGQLEEDAIYSKGEYISGKHWYENGQMRYDSQNNYTILDEDGLLTQRNGNWFYKNGNRRSEGGRLFSSDGTLAILTEPNDIMVNNYPTVKITYYNKVLMNSYQELLENIYLHAEDNLTFRQGVEVLLNSWIIALYNNNKKEEAISILQQMITDSERKSTTEPHFRVRHFEENFIRNSNIFIKQLRKGDFEISPTAVNHSLSTIIFD